MTVEWKESALQQYIDDQIEESLTLEYKAAGAFKKAYKEKTEITKDVSAMANSAGGILIYGIAEYKSLDKKHLPEKITPLDRKEFSKEWLEQVINNIQPRMNDLLIHPVSLSSGPEDVAYVVEIPQSTTAHQATDKRYYKRLNFVAEAMDDYEIRDILNRQSVPDALVEFGFDNLQPVEHTYLLKVYVINQGPAVIEHFQLEFTFPYVVGYERVFIQSHDNIDLRSDGNADYVITYRSKSVLFPNEKREIGHEMNWRYRMDSEKYAKLGAFDLRPGFSATRKDTVFVQWTLYADNMPPKKGRVPFRELHQF